MPILDSKPCFTLSIINDSRYIVTCYVRNINFSELLWNYELIFCENIFSLKIKLFTKTSYYEILELYGIMICKSTNEVKELKNKVILNLKQYCMRCFVALSYIIIILINSYEETCPIFKQEAAKKAGQL